MIILFVIALLLILNQFVSFLNGIVSELTQEIFERTAANNLNLKSPKNNQKLQKIWDKYDEVFYSLFLIQAFTVLLAVFLSGLNFNIIEFISIIPALFSSILLILGIIFTNLIFYFLGKRFCEKTILYFVSTINFITILFVPIVEKIMLIFIRISGKENDDVSMEEITDLVEDARKDGTINAGEYRLLKNVMNFNDILVSDVMTPRIVLFSCKANLTVSEAAKLPELQMFSRFPVWNGESIDDEIIGYVITKEVFNAVLNNHSDKLLSELARPINFIPENAELGKTLEGLLISKQHLYLVVDEYGGIEGIITMEDILETMLGVEIVDEADKIVDLRVLAKIRREARIKENYNLDDAE